MRIGFNTNYKQSFTEKITDKDFDYYTKGLGQAEKFESDYKNIKLEPIDLERISKAIPDLVKKGKNGVVRILNEIIKNQNKLK